MWVISLTFTSNDNSKEDQQRGWISVTGERGSLYYSALFNQIFAKTNHVCSVWCVFFFNSRGRVRVVWREACSENTRVRFQRTHQTKTEAIARLLGMKALSRKAGHSWAFLQITASSSLLTPDAPEDYSSGGVGLRWSRISRRPEASSIRAMPHYW